MAAGFTAAELQALIPRLRRYARALTGSREGADDLTQDTLERALAKRALWRDGSSLRAWVFTIMHNLFVNDVRARRATVSLDDPAHAPPESPDAAGAESGAQVAELQRALARLPDEQRAVVLLVGLEQLSYAEAAEALGVPIGTVMSRLSRGRERLRALLDGRAPDERPGLRRIK